uniref:Uncharacterized protein n=1 Tax=Lotharella oceanica TaxID=641309 RepID=A0A7S2XB62_9EUKA
MVTNTRVRWQANVNIIMDAVKRNLHALPIVAQAGCKSVVLEAMSKKDRDSFERFAYASYLLSVEAPSGNGANSSVALGLNAFYIDPNGTRYADIHDRYFYPLGAPTQFAPDPDVDFYMQKDGLTYKRTFENGVVLVNPTKHDTTGNDLGGSYVDPESNDPTKVVTSVDLPQKTAVIMLKA